MKKIKETTKVIMTRDEQDELLEPGFVYIDPETDELYIKVTKVSEYQLEIKIMNDEDIQ